VVLVRGYDDNGIALRAMVDSAASRGTRTLLPSSSAWTPTMIHDRAVALRDTLVRHRRQLHRHPELAWCEHRTAAYIESVLSNLGIEHRRVVGTGVVAVIEGRGERCVGVRADIDALPVTEAPGREGYRSENEGVSHACGHDAHVACVLGLAELLAGQAELPGTVVLYFQPAEEGGGGAEPMVAGGVLDDPTPDAILALHTASNHPAGTVGLRSGPVTAAVDDITLTIHGIDGHAAHPDRAIDPIPVAASFITNAQQIITREIDPLKPAVITFGSIHGGTRHNVIASSVTLEATMRSLYPDTRAYLIERIQQMAHAVASANRTSATVSIQHGYPAGFNDTSLTRLVERAARSICGDGCVAIEEHPSMGAEDFFEFGSTGIPVCMFRLGVANPSRGITAAHHSSHFDVDESALPVGVAVFAESVRRLLTTDTLSTIRPD
jgi:amidohydrolase